MEHISRFAILIKYAFHFAQANGLDQSNGDDTFSVFNVRVVIGKRNSQSLRCSGRPAAIPKLIFPFLKHFPVPQMYTLYVTHVHHMGGLAVNCGRMKVKVLLKINNPYLYLSFYTSVDTCERERASSHIENVRPARLTSTPDIVCHACRLHWLFACCYRHQRINASTGIHFRISFVVFSVVFLM